MTDTGPGRLAPRRRRGEPPADTGDDDDDGQVAAERAAARIGYVLLGASAVCWCLAAWLMHSPPAALIPAATALAAAGWDVVRG